MDSAYVKAFFDEVSTEWDDMRSNFYNGEVIDTLAGLAEVSPETTILDVGVGTGFVAAGIAPVAALVVGVDNSRSMLAVAMANLVALGANNVILVEGELDGLPLPDDSVDGSVANMVLHHAPVPARMVREMARVTRPGGRVALTDAVSHDHEWMRAEQADVWLGFSEGEVAQFFGEARLIDYGYASLGVQ